MINVILLGSSLFLLELLIMLAMEYLHVPEALIWQRTLWDATSVSLISVSALSYWLHLSKNISRSQNDVAVAVAKSATIIFSIEGALMLLLGLVPISMSHRQKDLLDALLFATIAAPAIRYWVIKPFMDKECNPSSSMSIRSSIALTIVISFSVFLFDISLPLGVAAGVPYIALVLVGLWFPQRNAAIILALIGTTLTIFGYYLSESMGIDWMVLMNRGLALFSIWITAILVTSQKLDTAELKLLHSIAESTSENLESDEVLRRGLAEICRYTEWPIGHAYLPAADLQDRLISSDIWYIEDSEVFGPFVHATAGLDATQGIGLPGHVLDSSEGIWINCLTSKLDPFRSKAAMAVGIKGGCAVPVFAGREVAAVMEFFSCKTEHPDAKMMKLLNDIGHQLGRVFERKKAEQQLSHMVSHDTLTGLPNLSLGRDRLSGAIAMARRSDAKAALMFIDLDDFKLINDTLGHDSGDQLLKEVSARLGSCIREVDTVARIGGDEFIIVLTNIDSNEGIERVAQKIVGTVHEPFRLQEQNASVGVSIGIAIYPEHGEAPEVLLKRADEAMYAIKAKGKNNYAFASG